MRSAIVLAMVALLVACGKPATTDTIPSREVPQAGGGEPPPASVPVVCVSQTFDVSGTCRRRPITMGALEVISSDSLRGVP